MGEMFMESDRMHLLGWEDVCVCACLCDGCDREEKRSLGILAGTSE